MLLLRTRRVRMRQTQEIDVRPDDVDAIRAALDQRTELAFVRPPSGWTLSNVLRFAVEDWQQAIEAGDHDDRFLWQAFSTRKHAPTAVHWVDIKVGGLREKADAIYDYLLTREKLLKAHPAFARRLYDQARDSINRRLIYFLAVRRYAEKVRPPSP